MITAVRAHVGLNLVFLVPGETGGMETYARELTEALRAVAPEVRLTAFVNREVSESDAGPWGDLVPAVTVPVRARNRLEWVRGEQMLLPRLAQGAGVELLHSLGSTAPAWGRYRRVSTIHDLHYRTVPEAHFGLRALGMRALVPLSARRADRVIADSEAVRDQLVDLLGLAREAVDVVPLGLGGRRRSEPLAEATLRERLDVGDTPLVLSVSAKRPHKNLAALLDALALIEADERPVLVLPGYPTEHEAELRRRAASLGLDGRTRFIGWVDEAELEGLYAAAACFVFPSLAEGFGLPVLEAMSRGVPVACSAVDPVGAVAGEAALKFDPRSPREIADAIRRLISDRDEAERLAAAGRARAATFTWEATARGTLASYGRVLGRALNQEASAPEARRSLRAD
jgi:glycosyltransferase involved in cell wall biosynthesis